MIKCWMKVTVFHFVLILLISFNILKSKDLSILHTVSYRYYNYKDYESFFAKYLSLLISFRRFLSKLVVPFSIIILHVHGDDLIYFYWFSWKYLKEKYFASGNFQSCHNCLLYVISCPITWYLKVNAVIWQML